MKGLKLAVCLMSCVALTFLYGLAAQASGFSPSLTTEEEVVPGSVVEVSFPYDGSLGEVAAFRVKLEYDTAVLEYLRPQYSEIIQEGFVTTIPEPGLVASVYTSKGKGPYLTEGGTIVYRFRVKEDAEPGAHSLFASVFEIAGPEPELIFGGVDVSLSFTVPQPPSSDARLLSLVPDHGTLEPEFHPDRFTYSMTVPYEVEAITFTAEPVAGALCRVNRKNLGAGGSDTLFLITVTAEDGETKNQYQVTVHREEKEEPVFSDDARLLSLVPSSGTLTPNFDPARFSYNVTVPYEVTSMTFTAQPVEGASYRVNRKNLGAGGSDTLFTITVTAEDGETKSEYHVTVHRNEKEEEESSSLNNDARLLSLVPSSGVLTPDFDPAQFSYNVTVPYEVTSMTFTAQPVEGASYRVNRKNLGAGGSDTLFTITVTAEDGETKSEYHVTVHRNEKEEEESSSLNNDARLLSLVPSSGVLTPDFDPAQFSYNVTVPYEVTSMTFTAQPVEGASYRVNRKNLGAGGSDTLFTITVTAEDGETKNLYQVTVYREEKGSVPSDDQNDTSKKDDSVISKSSSIEEPERNETVSETTSKEESAVAAGGITDQTNGSGGGNGSPSGGIVFQNGNASFVPAMLAMMFFVLVCFLSGPLSKELAKRFPGKKEDSSKDQKP